MVEGNGRDTSVKSTSELAGDLSRELATLVHEEIQLAKAELAQKGKRAGIGTALAGGAGIFAVLGLGALVASAVAALHLVVSVWLAALIVGVVVELIAGILALGGTGQVRRATPPVPEEAVESTKEDVRWLKSHARSARR